MSTQQFSISQIVDQSPESVYNTVLKVSDWWSGIYGETIRGNANSVGDEFIFEAGAGAHFSKQKLIELIPGKRIVWLVTDSRLSFLDKTDEWTGSKLIFDISPVGGKTKLSFSHEGLVPALECYGACSAGWTRYFLERLLPLLREERKNIAG